MRGTVLTGKLGIFLGFKCSQLLFPHVTFIPSIAALAVTKGCTKEVWVVTRESRILAR